MVVASQWNEESIYDDREFEAQHREDLAESQSGHNSELPIDWEWRILVEVGEITVLNASLAFTWRLRRLWCFGLLSSKPYSLLWIFLQSSCLSRKLLRFHGLHSIDLSNINSCISRLSLWQPARHAFSTILPPAGKSRLPFMLLIKEICKETIILIWLQLL